MPDRVVISRRQAIVVELQRILWVGKSSLLATDYERPTLNSGLCIKTEFSLYSV
jgi:hypothetical protein